jgi:hypothetical protein
VKLAIPEVGDSQLYKYLRSYGDGSPSVAYCPYPCFYSDFALTANMASPTYNESAIDTIELVQAPDIEMARTTPATSVKEDNPFLVAFSPSDHKNPLNWPTGRKWAVTDILSATGFNRIMVSTIMAPALPLIAKDLDMSSTEAVMALSIYLLATAFGPLFIGPLSEIYGRKRILHASNVWFLVWNVACGFAKTKGLLVAARFLAGFGASAIYALAGGVLGDVWRPEQRGRSLGIYLVIPVLGAAIGSLHSNKLRFSPNIMSLC